jgi:ankyrin repeat protein
MTNRIHAMTQLTALCEAMESTNNETVCRILDDNANFLSLGDARGEALRHAIANKLTGRVSLLLERGFHVTLEQAKKQPLLPHAAVHLDLCHMLVDLGIDVNESDENGFTALHRAVVYARDDVCEFLLGAGANPNVFNDRACTPLHNLTHVTNPRATTLARAFTAAGASASVAPIDPPADYLTPFQRFCVDARRRVVEYFLDQCSEDLHQSTVDGRSLDDLVTDEETRGLILMARTKLQVDAALDDEHDTSATLPSPVVTPSRRPTGFGPI